MPDSTRVLAICLESAEARVVRRLIDEGAMPTLARLAERSAWLRTGADPYISSDTPWPSFTGCQTAEEHARTYGEWQWDPARMRFAPQPLGPIEPLWGRMPDGTVGVVDLPWTPPSPRAASFVVRGWGIHSPTDRTASVWPPEAERHVPEKHPYHRAKEVNHWTGDRVSELSRVGADALRGLRIRGDATLRLLRHYRPEVALINFTELHRAGHWLWHTLEPDDPLFDSIPDDVRSLPVGLRDLYREADRQVGRLVEDAGPDAAVFVFALLGMEAGSGIPELLRPVLTGTGWAAPAPPREVALRRRLLGRIKEHTPVQLKRAWHARMPRDLTLRTAELLPEYDWAQTRAFALPSEQYGWVRLNVQGREAAGIIDQADYERSLDELESMLRSLTSPAGEPIVRDIVRPGFDNLLPDLVVYWARAAHGEIARLGDREFSAPKIVPWWTGVHAHEGFCMVPERLARGADAIALTELQELMLAAAAARVS